MSDFHARESYTSKLLEKAVREGKPTAILMMQAICPQTFNLGTLELMCNAASSGHLHVLKHCGVAPAGEQWFGFARLASRAVRHLDCLKWVLSQGDPRGRDSCDDSTLRQAQMTIQLHSLPALQRQLKHGHLSHNSTFHHLLIAAEMGDQPMLEWLTTQESPV